MELKEIATKILVIILALFLLISLIRIILSIDWNSYVPKNVSVPANKGWNFPTITANFVNRIFVGALLMVLVLFLVSFIMMLKDDFQKMVLIGALAILILTIFFITLINKSSANWPPIVSTCPDYFIDVSHPNDAGVSCKNNLNLGGIGVGPFVFSKTESDCNKYRWTKKTGVFWDGISNLIENPCD